MTPEEVFNLPEKDWISKIKTEELSMEFLACFASYIPDKAWNYLAIYQKLSEEFILKFSYKLDIPILLTSQKVHEKTIRENLNIFQEHIWHACRYQYLSEKFLSQHKEIVNWKQVFLNQKHLSTSFILRSFKNFPRHEFIYDPLDVFHLETYYKHNDVILKIVKDHNEKVRKVSAANRTRK